MNNQTQFAYSVQGTGFSSVNLLHVITRAKASAKKTAPATVLLNGNHYCKVDIKGHLIAA
jgi:hypothetical protein